MLKVGLTGGIGAGKSTVLLIFQSLGIPVYKADDRAKWLINNNSDITHLLSNEFGSDIYNEGQINTSYLSNIVFKDPLIVNKAIAQKVNLSLEGTSSSLRKMYRLFDLSDTKNKKLSLIMEVARISSE